MVAKIPQTQKNKENESGEGQPTSWSSDQKLREYYYDDAYGYEAFDPESEQDEEDESGEAA